MPGGSAWSWTREGSAVGGLARLKEWLRLRGRALEPAAAEFGLDLPRGVLSTGVPGCGKSLVVEAVAGEWGLPLVLLDPARPYGPYVGESEQRLREALRTLDAMVRRGRFDEVFFVDLPDPAERAEILRLHLASGGRPLTIEGILAETAATVPLSRARAEEVAALRACAGRRGLRGRRVTGGRGRGP